MKSVIAAITLTALTAFAQDAPEKQTEIPTDQLSKAVELFKTQNVEDIAVIKEYQVKARQLKAQLDELLPQYQAQYKVLKAADKAYARAKVPKIKTGNDREKVGWYYTGDPSAVMPMSEYENRNKGRGYDSRIKYKSYTPEELAAEKQAAKENLNAAKKAMDDIKSQMQKLREAYRANALEYKQKVEQMLQSAEGKTATLSYYKENGLRFNASSN